MIDSRRGLAQGLHSGKRPVPGAQLHPQHDVCGWTPGDPAVRDGPERFYTFAFGAGEPTASTYSLQAQPKGTQATGDKKCGCTLTYNQQASKGVGGGCGKAVSACW